MANTSYIFGQNNVECALCDILIDSSNDTKEHLIPNSIGGRRKIIGFICRSCNSKCGASWDAELSNQLNSFCLLLKVNRQDGKPRAQELKTVDGKSIRLEHDGSMVLPKPNIQQIERDGLIELKIQTRSLSEAKNMMPGLKRKYPTLNTEEFLAKLDEQSVALDSPLLINFEFGGSGTGRSLVKSTLALAVANGIDPRSCNKATTYLRSEKADPCFGYFYERDLILNRPQEHVFHCVAISGSAQTGQLLGYVEFFSAHRMVVCLSDSYTGPDVHDIYAIDPVSGNQVQLQFEIPLTQEDIAAIYRYEKIPPGSMEQAFEIPVSIAHKTDLQQNNERIMQEAVEYGFKNCGAKEDEELTEEQMKNLSNLIAYKLAELLRPRLRKY